MFDGWSPARRRARARPRPSSAATRAADRRSRVRRDGDRPIARGHGADDERRTSPSSTSTPAAASVAPALGRAVRCRTRWRRRGTGRSPATLWYARIGHRAEVGQRVRESCGRATAASAGRQQEEEQRAESPSHSDVDDVVHLGERAENGVPGSVNAVRTTPPGDPPTCVVEAVEDARLARERRHDDVDRDDGPRDSRGAIARPALRCPRASAYQTPRARDRQRP